MAVVVPNGNEGLETSPLSSAGLLLHRHDLQNIILQGRAEKEVDNLELLKSNKTKVRRNYRRVTLNLEFNWIRTQVNFTWFLSEDRRVRISS